MELKDAETIKVRTLLRSGAEVIQNLEKVWHLQSSPSQMHCADGVILGAFAVAGFRCLACRTVFFGSEVPDFRHLCRGRKVNRQPSTSAALGTPYGGYAVSLSEDEDPFAAFAAALSSPLYVVTHDDLAEQGQSLARNYRPGPRQARLVR